MTRGFVTIATGRKRYYIIAANLLASYRHFSASPLPFAIICDAENDYTKLFDDIVLLDNPHRSYLDKLVLPRLAPYDETIFIDADCLAYRDLNDFWNYFEQAADFTAFGTTHPADFPVGERRIGVEGSEHIDLLLAKCGKIVHPCAVEHSL